MLNIKINKITIRLITVVLFVILAAAGLLFSAYLFVISKSIYMDIIATVFLILSVISGFFNIFAAYWYYKAYFYSDHLGRVRKRLKPMTEFPTVAIAVPVYNEEPAVVKRTLTKLLELNYPKDRIKYYLLDDSTDHNILNQLRLFSKKRRIVYLHRESRDGYKGGALNNMLNVSSEEFIAVFDGDEYLTNKNFLIDLLPYFQEERLSYVQTEKRSAKGTFFSDSVDLFNAFFFRFIQTARALNNTAIFAGSCGVVRRSALDEIGGFPEYVIEDTFFSFESDEKNFRSLYVPKVYALGRPIKTFTSLAKQQWRYNYGDTQFLRYVIGKFRDKRKIKNITALSSIDYIAHGFGLNYLSIILIIFTLVSILIVFSAIVPTTMTPSQLLNFNLKNITMDLEAFGIISFVLSFFIPVILTKFYFNSIRKGFMIFLLNFSLAFVRLKAAIAAVMKLDPRPQWRKTQNEKGKRSVISTLYNTRFEITFSSILFVLGYISMVMSDNIAGGLWLIWYGALYSLATIFFHKYG